MIPEMTSSVRKRNSIPDVMKHFILSTWITITMMINVKQRMAGDTMSTVGVPFVDPVTSTAPLIRSTALMVTNSNAITVFITFSLFTGSGSLRSLDRYQA
jgi:hypothetical protein